MSTSNIADEIIKGIWIGNQDSSIDTNFIYKNKITAIVNCTPSLPNKFKNLGIKYIRVPVDDSLKMTDINNMTCYLPFIIQNIYKLHFQERRNVLIHCHAGMQRSTVVVAAYLVQYGNMTPKQAVKYIIQRRPIAFHNGANINFERSLLSYFKNMKKCTPVSQSATVSPFIAPQSGPSSYLPKPLKHPKPASNLFKIN